MGRNVMELYTRYGLSEQMIAQHFVLYINDARWPISA